ncbi:MAG: SseB family protein [Paracoccaceae bacterium]|nr:SseB family protein [Paracoccaceae bacterium]MDE3237770.1 SseB family protein [Paracoccaceae bacterium]
MTDVTPLDAAHAAMEAAPDDDALRLSFYARLTEGELYLLLDAEAEGETLSPRLFDLEEGRVVVAFDREDRLADFAEGPAPYAALPGRVLAGLLAREGLGLGLNLGVAPSSMLLPAPAMAWLAETLEPTPEEVAERVTEVFAPKGVPDAVLKALDAALARAAGLAGAAWLALARYGDGREGMLLAFTEATPGAETALARAAGEALTFSGAEAARIDVGFFAGNDPMVQRLARVALRFDLTLPEEKAPEPAAPGSNPARPPILR